MLNSIITEAQRTQMEYFFIDKDPLLGFNGYFL